MGWVTIATFNHPVEADLARSKLESEGIDSFIKDKNTIAANPFYSLALGGVKLQVKAEDVRQAREALGVPRPQGTVSCPRCDSEEISEVRPTDWLGLLASVLFLLPLARSKRSLRCETCGNEWKRG